MRDFLRAGLVVFCLMLVLVQSVPAFNVSQLNVHYSEVWPGALVLVSGTIDFAPSSGETFDSRHYLRFDTSLENAQWSWVPSEKEVVTPVTTSHPAKIPLPPPPFHYPKNENVIWKFTLEGDAPDVSEPTTITILRIQEVDENGILIPGMSREYGDVFLHAEGPIKKADRLQSSLEAFRDHIDEKAADGINTTLAETKYLEAQQKIDTSTSLPSSYYNALIEKIRILDSAQNDITEGERLLDKAWAEKAVADAQVPVNNADNLIAWFTRNASTKADVQLLAIIAKRELAVSNLTAASEDVTNGNYEQARLHAQKAFQNANESYNHALSRRQYLETSSCWGCGSGDITQYEILLAGIVAIILLIAGIIWWKKPGQ